jgi:hypothetical protein
MERRDFLKLVAAPIPAGETVDGQNLAKLLAGQTDPQHRDEFLSHYPHLRGKGKGNDYVTLYRRGKWILQMLSRQRAMYLRST